MRLVLQFSTWMILAGTFILCVPVCSAAIAELDTIAVIEGEAEGDFFGSAIGLVGDFDGDGVGDLVVGAQNCNHDAENAGLAYVYSGADLDAPPIILSAGDSAGPHDRFGFSVCGVGDVNGDSFDDIAVGAYSVDRDGLVDAGRVYLFLGANTEDGIAVQEIEVQGYSSFFGISIAPIGDYNNDGFADFIIGEPGSINAEVPGRAHIYFGANSPPPTCEITLEGVGEHDTFGRVVAQAGDLNGDGVVDFAIGAPTHEWPEGNRSGRVYIYYGGNPTGILPLMPDVVIRGKSHSENRLGQGITHVGDFDNDAEDDLLMGAYFRGNHNWGSALMLDKGDIEVEYLEADDLTEFEPLTGNAYMRFGDALCGLGDVNGDGYSDMAISAARFYSERGLISIFFGGENPDTVPDKEYVNIITDTVENLFGYDIASGKDFCELLASEPGFDNDRGRVFFLDLDLTPTVPEAPSQLQSDHQTSASINLKWVDNSWDENRFIIERSLDVAGPYMVVGEVGSNVRTFRDEGLDPETNYFYRVLSVVFESYASASMVIEVTTNGHELPTGSLPSGLVSDIGLPVTITAILNDDVAVEDALLYWRSGGDQEFLSTSMTQVTETDWTAVIPGSATTSLGVQYYIKVQDELGEVYLPDGAPFTNFGGISVHFNNAHLLDTPVRQYSLLSVSMQPLDMDPEWVFDELGQYDVISWRYFTYGENGSFREYDKGADPVEPGRGFWLITDTAEEIRMSGYSTALDSSFTIPLNPGWNLIGNPFGFPVNVSDIIFPDNVSQDFVSYDGTNSYQHFEEQLQPMAGYWLYLNGGVQDTLSIPPVGSIVQVEAKTRTSDPLGIDHSYWSVQVQGSTDEDLTATHHFGMMNDALDGLDARDFRDVPARPGSVSSLSLLREGVSLLADFTSIGAWGGVWELELIAESTGEDFELTFATENSLPAGWRLIAVDAEDYREIDITNGGIITVPAVGAKTSRTWWLVAGTSGFLEGMTESVREGNINTGTTVFLSSPWPNPALRATGPSVKLVASRAGKASLKVHDIRGRVVDVLLDGELPAGVHTFNWSGNDSMGRRAPSGVYFLRLDSVNGNKTVKVMLVR